MTPRLAPSGRTTADGAIRFGEARVGAGAAGHAPAAPRRPALRWAAVLVAALAVSGCVERTLMITSDPIGARAFVNGKDVGVTPVTIPFVHNQRFEYRIERPGYRSVAGEVTTPSTWDSVPGIDFFAENAYPGRIRRQTVRVVKLERLTEAPSRAELEAKFRQADAFRVRAETETGGEDIPAPTRPDRVAGATPAAPKAATQKAGTPGAPAGGGKPPPPAPPSSVGGSAPPSPLPPPPPPPTAPQAGAPASR